MPSLCNIHSPIYTRRHFSPEVKNLSDFEYQFCKQVIYQNTSSLSNSAFYLLKWKVISKTCPTGQTSTTRINGVKIEIKVYLGWPLYYNWAFQLFHIFFYVCPKCNFEERGVVFFWQSQTKYGIFIGAVPNYRTGQFQAIMWRGLRFHTSYNILLWCWQLIDQEWSAIWLAL